MPTVLFGGDTCLAVWTRYARRDQRRGGALRLADEVRLAMPAPGRRTMSLSLSLVPIAEPHLSISSLLNSAIVGNIGESGGNNNLSPRSVLSKVNDNVIV